MALLVASTPSLFVAPKAVVLSYGSYISTQPLPSESVSYKRPPSMERAISLSGNQFSAVVGSQAGCQIHSGWLSSWSKSREKNAILFLADELIVGEKR